VLQYLADNHITPSMSRKWSPWENGAQESYYGKFKLELGSPRDYETIEMLILAIHQRIHYYNHERLHTKLRDTPVWFEKKYETRKQQALSSLHNI
jgi:putative transposase